MKLIESYHEMKQKYPTSLIFLEAGNFYEVLEDDAYILHYLLKYKILYKKNYIQVGFPKKFLPTVSSSLKEFSIVIKMGGGREDKINFSLQIDNHYYSTLQYAKKYYTSMEVIEGIEKMLIEVIDSKKFPRILKAIRGILNE